MVQLLKPTGPLTIGDADSPTPELNVGKTMQRALPQQWSEALWLEHRSQAECVTSIDKIEPGPYAGPLRDAFAIGLTAVFCIDRTPAVAILALDENESLTSVNKVHHALWNQGLADLLLVTQGDILRVFSLWKQPKKPNTIPDKNDDRLIEELHRIADVLKLQDFLSGIESGRLTREAKYKSAFDEEGRVDMTLLRDLETTRKRITKRNISVPTAHALLLQTMFLAYLWDREIIDADYLAKDEATASFSCLEDMLNRSPLVAWRTFLKRLDRDFNGDMFIVEDFSVWERAAEPLTEFLKGDMDLETRQGRLLRLYQFNHIPVELLSEVYDRFLEAGGDKRKQGAYYTPRRLAALVADQAWELLKLHLDKGSLPRVLDPACGSGIFLVALFHRMVAYWRATSDEKPGWHALKRVAETLHGTDNNPTAIRIAAFSLSLAMLDEEEPRQIQHLLDQGKILPRLLGGTLNHADFFNLPEKKEFDLVIGNPPWGQVKDRAPRTSGEMWCDKNRLSPPQREMAWPFVWKAPRHLTPGGKLVLLLPVTRFFFNSSNSNAIKFWLESGHLLRLINLADMRELLFPKGKVPACIITYDPETVSESYRIEYWSPKADLNVVYTGRITLAPSDKCKIWSSHLAVAPSEICKQSMWASAPERNLLQYIKEFKRVGDLIWPTKKSSETEW